MVERKTSCLGLFSSMTIIDPLYVPMLQGLYKNETTIPFENTYIDKLIMYVFSILRTQSFLGRHGTVK